MENKNIRCKACFKCEEYIIIHSNNSISQIKLDLFKKLHAGHPIQTMYLHEMDINYTYVNIKIGKEREETFLEIQEMLKK